MVYEDQVRGELARGELVSVLEEFSTPFPGFYLYYPQRRHASPALHAFIEYLRPPARRKTTKRAGRATSDSRRVDVMG